MAGRTLRDRLGADFEALLRILGQSTLLERADWTRESLGLRNIYTVPLNVLQAELLARYRESGDEHVKQAVMISIAGVAAGMRNTG